MLSRCSLAALRMFAGFFLDVFRMLRWVLWAWWNYRIISNESTDFNDPNELDDPQLFDDPSDYQFDNPKVYGDTSITALKSRVARNCCCYLK